MCLALWLFPDDEESIEKWSARLALGKEDGGGLDYDDALGHANSSDLQRCLVGKFLTDKLINFPYMKHTLSEIWRPMRGMCIMRD